MHLDHDELRTWLRRVLEHTGDTPTSLARKAGVAQSTLTRFLNSDDAPLLSTRSISKIAHAANYNPPGIAHGPSAAVRAITHVSGLQEAEAAPYKHGGASQSQLDGVIAAILAGRNATDPWVLRSAALVDAGYLPGDILFVDLSRKPEDGDLVCAQVYKWSKGTAETVFRFYDPPYLVAATSSRDLRRPLLVDNDRVIIKGVVTESLRIAR